MTAPPSWFNATTVSPVVSYKYSLDDQCRLEFGEGWVSSLGGLSPGGEASELSALGIQIPSFAMIKNNMSREINSFYVHESNKV